MNVEHVDSQVVGGQIHRFKDLIQSLLTAFIDADNVIAVVFNLLLNEAQQMFLIHARRCVNVGIHLTRKCSIRHDIDRCLVTTCKR